jgi:hypothetical protein
LPMVETSAQAVVLPMPLSRIKARLRSPSRAITTTCR